ncbi:hypothetical protein BB558_006765 [Smittium angustum]|uniref:SIS domain-containing protein n=1 Tax=Smittium angustum TaxID=133377 RepID=A0A2U1IX24_SMIAN|nr:hypothetical protein BB558_006765 [Smittium angustum]
MNKNLNKKQLESSVEDAVSMLYKTSQSISKMAEGLRNNPTGYQQALKYLYKASKNGNKVIITGVGKSFKIGQKIAATLTSTGTVALAMHSTEAVHGDLGVLRPGDVVIAISYSGKSEELIQTISHIHNIREKNAKNSQKPHKHKSYLQERSSIDFINNQLSNIKIHGSNSSVTLKYSPDSIYELGDQNDIDSESSEGINFLYNRKTPYSSSETSDRDFETCSSDETLETNSNYIANELPTVETDYKEEKISNYFSQTDDSVIYKNLVRNKQKVPTIPIISICGDENSPLAKLSDVWLDASVECEASNNVPAPTISTSVALALGDVICMSLMDMISFGNSEFKLCHPGGNLGRIL